jgi:hypothetical protein
MGRLALGGGIYALTPGRLFTTIGLRYRRSGRDFDEAKLLSAAALTAVMGSCVTAHATITYNDIASFLPFTLGSSIPLSSLVTANPDPGTAGGEITIFDDPAYTVSGAFYHVGTDYYSANLWGYNNIPNTSYTGVTITPKMTGNISVGGGTYDFASNSDGTFLRNPGTPEVWGVSLPVGSACGAAAASTASGPSCGPQRPQPTPAQKASAAAQLVLDSAAITYIET